METTSDMEYLLPGPHRHNIVNRADQASGENSCKADTVRGPEATCSSGAEPAGTGTCAGLMLGYHGKTAAPSSLYLVVILADKTVEALPYVGLLLTAEAPGRGEAS
jgi:hypothetical protein